MKRNQSIIKIGFFLLMVFPLAVLAQQAKFKLPAYEKFKLPNGLTIYLMEQHEVPTINIAAVIPSGAVLDADKKGLASLTAKALQFGTKSYTKAQIEEQMDFIGASYNTYAGKELAGLSAKFAAKHQDKVLPIINELLTAPSFNEEEFSKEKQRILTQLERAKESPRSVIGNYWDNFMYGNHPYGNPVSGSVSSVQNLAVADVKGFYSINYGPNGAAIAIVGDFKAKEMKAKISKLFGKWTNPVSATAVASTIESPKEARVLLVNKGDARETTMLIGGKGVSRNNPDFVAIEVVNTVLGGRFTSWLNDELRVNSGLTYGANSRFSTLKNSGTFYISTFTATATTKATVDKALEVLKKLQEKGLDEATLQSAKNYVKGQFPPDYETPAQLALLLTDMFWYNFNEDFINTFESKVDGLTVEKSKDIIQKYFSANNLQFLFVGNAAEIKNVVSTYGKVTEKQIKEDSF
ncbi:peptidase M16 inactive domain protein [Pedobacter glucosidilyticus]|nr:pitrilysin family protein [Pedobacter glucosidilyticus]KHJ38672.1 peptidase M16 inactive domain protein [Pedobacter glucosidilyticus]